MKVNENYRLHLCIYLISFYLIIMQFCQFVKIGRKDMKRQVILAN